MAFQFHTTTFGQLVRLFSGNKIFQYPDEIDPLLWKKFLRQNVSEPMDGSDIGPRKNEITEDGVPENTVLHDGEQEILLVEWYGPDDPEVGHFTSNLQPLRDSSTRLYSSNTSSSTGRILETGH